MKFGIPLARAHPGLWPDLNKRAEGLGFESVWLGIDRLIVAPWQRTREALEGIAGLAGEYVGKFVAIG